MAVGSISYYFTLFKKFQVLNHVPEQSVHGDAAAPTGGFNLTAPNCAFGGSASFPALLGSTPANSPLWQILNAAATGQPSVTIGAYSGPSMPAGASATYPASWAAFQVNAPVPIVSVFGSWITGGGGISAKQNDIPSGVVNPTNGAIANVPATIAAPLDNGVSLFVCSMPNDNGARPGPVPSDYWATSLIYLIDPSTGHTATPTTLNAGDEWFLVGVVGNRGNAEAGEYLSGAANPGVESAGVVMVWNTTFSPGVELPALSNLDVTDTNPIYDSYIMRSASYDVVGFRLNVQNVFNGIIAALTQAVANNQINLGGLTPTQWVLQSPAHLCAKILIRPQGGAFPNVGDTPITNAALAQKNLAPFELTISDTDTNPTNIVWKTFVSGTPYFLKLPGGGLSRMGFVLRLPDDTVKLQLGIPTVTFERYFRNGPGRLNGFREIPPKTLCESPHGCKAKPFPDAVVLEHLGGEHVIEFPALPDNHFLGMAVGIEYEQRKLKPGPLGEIDLVHRAEMPTVRHGTHSYDIEERVVGGFTLQLRAVDVTPMAKGRKTRP
jgi:hypothetical protein